MTVEHVDTVIKAKRVGFSDGVRPASVGIIGETIACVEDYAWLPESYGELMELPDDQVLMPGFVDSHVHINEPGRTDWEGYESATRAGLAGGITTIVDMPLNSSPPTTTEENLDIKIAAAQGKLSVDVGLWGGAVPGNLDDLETLWNRGVFGFKSFTAHSGIDEYGYMKYPQIREVLKKLASLGGVLIVHAEDPADLDAAPQRGGPSYADYLASRPRAAENNAIKAVIEAARETGARVHILHLSSSDALPLIRQAKADGVALTVETCPHYLTFAAENIPDGATQYKCAPPIRQEENRRKLWQGVLDGTIDHVASDHSPCVAELKHMDVGDFQLAWGGISSVQLGFSAIWTAGEEFGITLEDIARFFAEAPARNFSIPRKGAIKAGNDADFAVIAPEEVMTVDVNKLEHKNKISPYHGKKLRGAVVKTILRGRAVDRDSKAGKLLYRQ